MRKRLQKIARKKLEGFNHLKKTILSSVQDADLPEDEILEVFKPLSWYIHRFLKVLFVSFLQLQNQ